MYFVYDLNNNKHKSNLLKWKPLCLFFSSAGSSNLKLPVWGNG